jgi:hypothetical protein
MFSLQIPQRAEQLAIPNLVTAGEQGLQCVHERHSLVGLERTGGVDNGEPARR